MAIDCMIHCRRCFQAEMSFSMSRSLSSRSSLMQAQKEQQPLVYLECSDEPKERIELSFIPALRRFKRKRRQPDFYGFRCNMPDMSRSPSLSGTLWSIRSIQTQRSDAQSSNYFSSGWRKPNAKIDFSLSSFFLYFFILSLFFPSIFLPFSNAHNSKGIKRIRTIRTANECTALRDLLFLGFSYMWY